MALELRLDPAGRIVSLAFDRWGDPDGRGFGWHRFGGEVTGWASFGGLTIPSAGRLGWHPGGDRFAEGEFFRYRITALQPVGPGAGSAVGGGLDAVELGVLAAPGHQLLVGADLDHAGRRRARR